jgi:Cu/Ag efflux pump CusA
MENYHVGFGQELFFPLSIRIVFNLLLCLILCMIPIKQSVLIIWLVKPKKIQQKQKVIFDAVRPVFYTELRK